MPDIFLVIARRWSLLLFLTLAGTAAALIASLVSPKYYLSETTALPANTALNDKSRLFNSNIQSLYSELGSADDLDKMEGTARLDTVFLAVASSCNLAAHYNLDTAAEDALEKAGMLLRKSSNITKTGYGELNIKVWDKDNATAARLANGLMQTINAIHERLQTENNRNVLQKLKEQYAKTSQSLYENQNRFIEHQNNIGHSSDTSVHRTTTELQDVSGTNEELKQYEKNINEYELAIKTSPKPLLVVEQARPSAFHDRPKTFRNVLLAFTASLLFSFLLAVFIESRNGKA